MMKSSGKIIKKGSKLSMLVKDIDIFKENLDKVVKNIDMEYVGENSKEVKPVFNPEDIFKKALKKASEKAVVEVQDEPKENVKSKKKESENPFLKTIKELETKNQTLNKEIKQKNQEIELLKKEIEDLKISSRKNGYDLGYQEGFSKASADVKNNIENSLKNIEENFNKTMKKATTESKELLDFIKELIEKGVKKIVGEAFSKESLIFLIDKISSDFSSEDKIVLRVSPDIYNTVKEIELSDKFSILKDASMKKLSIFAEMENGVADYSISTQIKKIIEMLDGE